MDPSGIWQLLILFILLILSAFFSSSETALMSLSKIRLRQMIEEKVKGAERVYKLIGNSGKLFEAVLISRNIVNIAASAIATSIAIRLTGDKGVGIATGVMTVLILIFGEITPKSFAAQNSEKISLKVAGIMLLIVRLLNPVVIAFTHVNNFLIKILGGNPAGEQSFIIEEEFKAIVEESHEEGLTKTGEREMIYNVFKFGDLYVRDVMVPRTDIVAVEVEWSYERIMEVIKSEQFSCIPVYKETIDDIVGILHVKDLVFFNSGKEDFNINKFIREPYYTYEFKKITELFEEMKRNKAHMSIVLDEYGGVVGIATMEDLIEEIVGEIQDEYDDESDEIDIIKEDEYVINGNVKLDIVNDMIGTDIESEKFDSIGGFIIGQLGRLPKPGETIEFKNIKFVVEGVQKNRIKKVRVYT
ncbi:hemolysin family protein [Fonticella tunisiensis]|uniref:Putative hemolysin n=1 Tax=Fonticella tunisiensis TaxID=1096341 RepID=A0A4R7KPV9_9CLOT|nr:hemolysin family protein [Fonticella tunisiensis]TDT57289.1 putative hemolysin [Fonticella tunisiensis]